MSVRTLQEWRQNGRGPAYLKLSRGKRGVIRYDPVYVRSFMRDRKIRRRRAK